MFGGHRHCGSGITMALFCCVILEDHKGHVTLWVGAHEVNLSSCQVWGP